MHMAQVISCCGVACSACEYYPEQCPGCSAVEGKAFWLQYTGESVCSIFACCVTQKGYSHCGKCAELPCALYTGDDTGMTQDTGDTLQMKQIKVLKNLP